MEIIQNAQILREKLHRIGKDSVGLIYTKGRLHKGHRMLIEAARKENFIVVVANLIVPREFGSLEAYNLYPKCTKEDEMLASLAGTDFFFAPDIELFETDDITAGIKLNDYLKSDLNGQDRPYYYEEQLVTLMKLLNITKPNRLYISDKDLQQVYFTKRFLKQFYFDCELKVLPVVRDEDNIILGGKNELLKQDERKQVSEVYNILMKAQRAYQKGMVSSRKLKWHVENEMTKLYLCKVEFVEVLEPERLRKIETITDEAILTIGIKVGKLRLCDHIRF